MLKLLTNVAILILDPDIPSLINCAQIEWLESPIINILNGVCEYFIWLLLLSKKDELVWNLDAAPGCFAADVSHVKQVIDLLMDTLFYFFLNHVIQLSVIVSLSYTF
jgi:hypothetical protein